MHRIGASHLAFRAQQLRAKGRTCVSGSLYRVSGSGSSPYGVE